MTGEEDLTYAIVPLDAPIGEPPVAFTDPAEAEKARKWISTNYDAPYLRVPAKPDIHMALRVLYLEFPTGVEPVMQIIVVDPEDHRYNFEGFRFPKPCPCPGSPHSTELAAFRQDSKGSTLLPGICPELGLPVGESTRLKQQI